VILFHLLLNPAREAAANGFSDEGFLVGEGGLC